METEEEEEEGGGEGGEGEGGGFVFNDTKDSEGPRKEEPEEAWRRIYSYSIIL